VAYVVGSSQRDDRYGPSRFTDRPKLVQAVAVRDRTIEDSHVEVPLPQAYQGVLQPIHLFHLKSNHGECGEHLADSARFLGLMLDE